MSKNLMENQQESHMSKFILTGALIGGILGIFIGFFYRTGILFIPFLGSIFSVIPVDGIIAGTILGMIIGASVGAVTAFFSLGVRTPDNVLQPNITNIDNQETDTDESKILLKEEKLNIAKEWMQTGEANIKKNVYTEEKNFTVPITHEELIVEKKIINPDSASNTEMYTETIRIPLKEERVEITKHPVNLEDVSVYTNQYQENRHIEETLKKEELRVKTKGDAKVHEKKI